MTLPTKARVQSALSALWTRLTADLEYLWANDKIFLVIFGVLILIAKGSSSIISLLAGLSKEEVNAATKQNAVLQAEENAANAQANTLVDTANSLPGQEKPVTDPNWDKKK